jgi:polar amino acid transport system substrate-binding protein
MSPRIFSVIAILALPLSAWSRTKIVLAAEDDWYPYSAKIDTVAQGLAPELILAAFDAAGADVTYKVVPFSRAMAGVKDGTYAGCFDAGISKELRAEYLVPKQILAFSYQVVWGRPSGAPVGSYSDFEGKKVGIVNAYTYSPLLTENDKIAKDVAQHEIGNLKKLANGRIEYTIVDRWVAKYLISANKQELSGKIKQLGIIQTDTIVPVFSKIHPDGSKAKDLYDKGMSIIRRNGTYDRIMAGWESKFQEPGGK